jgi:hypothetical protein
VAQIHDAIVETEEEMTPLKKKLDEFGTFLAKVSPSLLAIAFNELPCLISAK